MPATAPPAPALVLVFMLLALVDVVKGGMLRWIACAAAILITLIAVYFSKGLPILPGQGIADNCRQFHVDPFYPNGPRCR